MGLHGVIQRKARRQNARALHPVLRRAQHSARALLLGLGVVCQFTPAHAEITAAEFTEPTTRYAHGILGDRIEWGTMAFTLQDQSEVRIVLPPSRVFEDLVPRLVDIDQNGTFEAMVVESSQTEGARLALYNETGLIAATPYIGRRNRWLAPIGAADLNGDGHIEVAYIDRPHLAKTLRVWSFRDGALVEIASKQGLTNHRIGEDFISGGLRSCAGAPELITADSDWNNIVATKLVGETLVTEVIGTFSQKNIADALSCD